MIFNILLIRHYRRSLKNEKGTTMEKMIVDKSDVIRDTAMTVEMISYQIADLLRVKEELEEKLKVLLNHPEEGSKTYVYGKYKITATTGFIYTLDKDGYMLYAGELAPSFNPVSMKTIFELNKQIIRDCEKYGSARDLSLLSKMISKKPKKLHIRISGAS